MVHLATTLVPRLLLATTVPSEAKFTEFTPHVSCASASASALATENYCKSIETTPPVWLTSTCYYDPTGSQTPP